jgi:formylglycine-generating enzyme required for sulfatase activity
VLRSVPVVVAVVITLLGVAACKKSDTSDKPVASGDAAPVATADAAPATAPPADAAPAAAGCPAGTVELEPAAFTSVRGGEVALPATCLDVTEVTIAAYRDCVTAGKCTEPDDPHGECDYTAQPGGADQLPVNCVTAAQAEAFCAYAGKRLPSADELEWAQRGGAAGTRYPWGNDADGARLCPELATRDGDVEPTGCPVGQCAAGASPQGIHDLVAGVSEWATTGKPGEYWNCGGLTDCTAGHKPELDDRHVAGWCSTTIQPDLGYAGVGIRCAATW